VTTFLHHNEPGVPWYGNDEWTFVKGALSSVDRDYWPFNTIVHDIGTHQASCHSQSSPACAPSSPLQSHERVRTRHPCGEGVLWVRSPSLHVCVCVCVAATSPLHGQVHHLFPHIPHYHLKEATAAFRAAYPSLVRQSDEPIVTAFVRNVRSFLAQPSLPDNLQHFAYKRE
jgi:hypothetical protein